MAIDPYPKSAQIREAVALAKEATQNFLRNNGDKSKNFSPLTRKLLTRLRTYEMLEELGISSEHPLKEDDDD